MGKSGLGEKKSDGDMEKYSWQKELQIIYSREINKEHTRNLLTYIQKLIMNWCRLTIPIVNVKSAWAEDKKLAKHRQNSDQRAMKRQNKLNKVFKYKKRAEWWEFRISNGVIVEEFAI